MNNCTLISGLIFKSLIVCFSGYEVTKCDNTNYIVFKIIMTYIYLN